MGQFERIVDRDAGWYHSNLVLAENAKMSAMGRQLGDDWVSTTATILACKQTLLGRDNFSSENYSPAEYVVSFSYVVRDQSFEGSYRVNSPQERGHSFEILYDPRKPSRNTGSDVLDHAWVRWGVRIIGFGAAILASWLWGDKIGF